MLYDLLLEEYRFDCLALQDLKNARRLDGWHVCFVTPNAAQYAVWSIRPLPNGQTAMIISRSLLRLMFDCLTRRNHYAAQLEA